MTYDAYHSIFIASLVACGVMVAVSAVLFFVLRIPRVIGDLTGRTARKAIEDIRKQNEQSGDKTYKSSAVNLQRGKLTDRITKSGRLVKRADTPFGTGSITEELENQPNFGSADETTVLSSTPETTVLYTEPANSAPVVADPAQAFTIEYEITFIHTNEWIP